MSGERGAGSVLGIAVIGGVVCLVGMLVPLHLALAAKQAVSSSADAAALAAADVRVGVVPGLPCQEAATVAEANGSALDRCELDGLVVTVVVSRSIIGIPVAAAATAGPPGAGRD